MSWILVVLALATQAKAPAPPRLVLSVTGTDAAPAAEWSKARRVVTRILERAGVVAVWGEGCGPRAVCLQFLSVRPPQAHEDAAGYAVLTGDGAGYAAVYLPGVARTAEELDADRGLVLGVTMAHEIGHMLLGRAHSRGVMSARFGWREMWSAARGELLFGDAEARRLRAEAIRRSAIP